MDAAPAAGCFREGEGDALLGVADAAAAVEGELHVGEEELSIGVAGF